MQTVVGAVLVDEQGRVLAARRSGPSALAGGWEFPGGKVEAGESETAALERELVEELRVDIEVGERIEGEWQIPPAMVLHLYLARIRAGVPAPHDDHDEVRWVRPEQFDALTWLPVDAAALPAVVGALLRTP